MNKQAVEYLVDHILRGHIYAFYLSHVKDRNSFESMGMIIDVLLIRSPNDYRPAAKDYILTLGKKTRYLEPFLANTAHLLTYKFKSYAYLLDIQLALEIMGALEPVIEVYEVLRDRLHMFEETGSDNIQFLNKRELKKKYLTLLSSDIKKELEVLITESTKPNNEKSKLDYQPSDLLLVKQLIYSGKADLIIDSSFDSMKKRLIKFYS
jgi:hypothetical protein